MSKKSYEPSFVFEPEKESGQDVYIYVKLEEYRELLEMKGRYKELKEIYDREKALPTWNPTKITWNGTDITCKEPDNYTYTCGCNRNE